MKKVFFISIAATILLSCNNSQTNDNGMVDSDPMTTTTPAYENTSYAPSEGDVIYRNGHLEIYRDNGWVVPNNDITLDDGIVVYKNGEVKKDNNTIQLKDGEVVTHEGNFIDKTGKVISDAWESAKQGVSKAGEAVGDAASDAGKAVGNAADKTANAVKEATDNDKN